VSAPQAPITRSWFREPLVQFAALAVGIFAVYAATVGSSTAEPSPATVDAGETIVVDDAIRRMLVEGFERNVGRPPTDDETATMVSRFVDEEVAYREGVRLGLDLGDPVVRDRVIARYVDANVDTQDIPTPNDEALAAFLTAHADRYREGARLDFEQVFISRRRHDDAELLAASVLTALEDGADPRQAQGRYSAGRRFTIGRVAGTYGRALAEGVADLEAGEWRRIEVDSGYHLVRITKRDAGGAVPPLRRIRGRVRNDYLKAEKRRRRDALVDELRHTYLVDRSPA